MDNVVARSSSLVLIGKAMDGRFVAKSKLLAHGKGSQICGRRLGVFAAAPGSAEMCQ
jgi:hypothetical protein